MEGGKSSNILCVVILYFHMHMCIEIEIEIDIVETTEYR